MKNNGLRHIISYGRVGLIKKFWNRKTYNLCFYLFDMDKHVKNIGAGILSFLLLFGIFRITSVVVETQFWVTTLLLLLIYFELWDKK